MPLSEAAFATFVASWSEELQPTEFQMLSAGCHDPAILNELDS